MRWTTSSTGSARPRGEALVVGARRAPPAPAAVSRSCSITTDSHGGAPICSCTSADAPASCAQSVQRPSVPATVDSPASASPTMKRSSTWRAMARQSRKRAWAVAAVALHEREPGAVDQRLDEPAVVAEAAAQLERLVEVLLGVLGAGRDHVVPAELGQRRGGAVRVAELAVELERLGGERHRAVPVGAALADAGADQQRVGDQLAVAGRARRGERGVAQLGRLGARDERRPAAERDQHAASRCAVAGLARGVERGPQPRLGLGEARLRDREPPVPVERGRAQAGRVGVEREPAAHLLRVRVPRQRVGEADRDPQRLVDRAGAQQAARRRGGCSRARAASRSSESRRCARAASVASRSQ